MSLAADICAEPLIATLRRAQSIIGVEVDAAQQLWAGVALALDPTNEDAILSDFGLQGAPLRAVTTLLEAAEAASSLSVSSVGAAFEAWSAGRQALARRDQGVYYTPPTLASLVAEQALQPLATQARSVDEVLAITICDPAAGAGAFLLPAVELLSCRLLAVSGGQLNLAAARSLVVRHCIYAVDTDPLVVALLRTCLRSLTEDQLAAQAVGDHVVTADAVGCPSPWATPNEVTAAWSWAAAFPDISAGGGFRAVLSNPPWGAVKPARREWFGARDARVRALQGQALTRHIEEEHAPLAAEWQEDSASRRAYAAALRSAYGYGHQGPGDTDFYRFFIERAYQLVQPGGRICMVVPGALYRAEGASQLRRLLLEDGTFDCMLDFLNTGRIFDIHSMFRFVVFAWQQGEPRGVTRMAFALRSVAEARISLHADNGLRMSLGDLQQVGGHRLSIPDVRSGMHVELLKKLHDQHPLLGDRSSTGWQVQFARELDMTNDSAHFIDVHAARAHGAVQTDDGSWDHPEHGPLLPVYEGRMVHQFNAAAKTYLSGHGRMAKWAVNLEGRPVQPHYLVSEAVAVRRGVPLAYRAGFCDVTGHANERTVLGALIPPRAVCGNKVPTCRFDRDDPDLHLLWLGLANSVVVDWVLRRRVSTTLNFFLWAQVPMPRLDPHVGIGAELVGLSSLILNRPHDEEPRVRLRALADLRAEQDAAVARLYGLDLRELAFLFEDFPLMDRGAGRGRTITRDLVLWKYSGERNVKLTDLGVKPGDGPNDVQQRVEMARDREQLAYVPGEVGSVLGR